MFAWRISFNQKEKIFSYITSRNIALNKFGDEKINFSDRDIVAIGKIIYAIGKNDFFSYQITEDKVIATNLQNSKPRKYLSGICAYKELFIFRIGGHAFGPTAQCDYYSIEHQEWRKNCPNLN